MVNRWENPKYSVFSLLFIDNARLGVDCPKFLGYSPVRVEKTWIRLAAITLWSNMPNIQVSKSMCERFSGDSWYDNQV